MNTSKLESAVFRGTVAGFERLREYHQHEVVGLDHLVDVGGPVVAATNHSLATYDACLLALAIYERTGKWSKMMADRLFFRIPVVGPVVSAFGFVNGNRDRALELLASGESLGVIPGGMRESLRGSNDKYRVEWRGRLGFVWLSLLSGAPIVLAACPRADDIYDVYPNPITRWAYDRFRVPVPVARGRGPTLLPRPVRLTHLVSEPIPPPVAPDRVTAQDVRAHHARVTDRMTALMQQALELSA